MGLVSAYVMNIIIIGFFLGIDVESNYTTPCFIFACFIIAVYLLYLKWINTRFNYTLSFFNVFAVFIYFLFVGSISVIGVDLEKRSFGSDFDYLVITDNFFESGPYGGGYYSEHDINYIVERELNPDELIHTLNNASMERGINWQRVNKNGLIEYEIDGFEYILEPRIALFWEPSFLTGSIPLPKDKYPKPSGFFDILINYAPVYFFEKFLLNIYGLMFVGIAFWFFKFRKGDEFFRPETRPGYRKLKK